MNLFIDVTATFYACCGLVVAAVAILAVLVVRADRDERARGEVGDDLGDDALTMIHGWDAALERLVREGENHA